MRRVLLLLSIISFHNVLPAQSIHLSGFYDSNAVKELKTEKAFDDQINRENIGKTIQGSFVRST